MPNASVAKSSSGVRGHQSFNGVGSSGSQSANLLGLLQSGRGRNNRNCRNVRCRQNGAFDEDPFELVEVKDDEEFN